MLEFLVPLLAFVAVISVGGAVIAIVASRKRSLAARLQGMDADIGIPVQAPTPAIVRLINSIGSFGRGSTALKEKLAQVGWHNDTAVATFLGAKFLLFVIGVGGAAGLMILLNLPLLVEVYLAILVAALLFFLPNYVVRKKWTRRRDEIRRHLPGAIDLIEICVSSGMGLDMAWTEVATEIRGVSPMLADDMQLTVFEMQLGATRAEAMRKMAARTGAKELASLVALLVQTERFGTNLGDALRTFAVSMRDARSYRAEEMAEKMAVRLLFPLVFFIFPVMLIVMMGPACITLYRVIGPG